MAMPRARGLVGASVAVAALAAAALFPLTLAPEAPRPAPVELPEPPAAAAELPPGPAGVADHIDAQLGLRMQLEPFDRQRIARAILVESTAARIDPLLVLALIEVESSFDPEALSDRGAQGLMQLREPTMRRELQRHGLALDDPLDPVANVRAGVRYLRRLLDAFGREEVALMAYNAGPNRILGYLREGAIPERFHVYPRRVKAELRRLRRSLGQEPPTAVAAVRPPALAE